MRKNVSTKKPVKIFLSETPLVIPAFTVEEMMERIKDQ